MKRSRHTITVGALLVVGAIVLSGCGGGGTKPLSKAELAAQANKICVKSNNEWNKTASHSGIRKPISQADFAKIFALVADNVAAETAEWRKLTPPSEEKATYQRFLKIMDEQIRRARDLASLYQKGDTTKAHKVMATVDAADAATETPLEQLGADTCASLFREE